MTTKHDIFERDLDSLKSDIAMLVTGKIPDDVSRYDVVGTAKLNAMAVVVYLRQHGYLDDYSDH